MKLNESHANKKYLLTNSFQLHFLVYQPSILFLGLINIIKVGYSWSITCGYHESTPTPGTGNGSQADYKWNNNAIQTRKFSQYITRTAGKSIWIHFLESNFPQILILASSYIFETCHLKTSLRLLVLFPM